MRFTELKVRNYRLHKEAHLTFDASRNLIGGDNEAGKSTLAEAIHRGLFLKAKTGGNLQREMQSDTHQGSPEVELTFEANGSSWHLLKSFAGASKGSTKLTESGQNTLRDTEAEEKLAEILGFKNQTGRSTANQLLSYWAHLWVWQGSSGEDPSLHTREHKDTLVQRLQKEGIAAVMQSTADQAAAEKIANRYDELYTGTGKLRTGSTLDLAAKRVEEAQATLTKANEGAQRLHKRPPNIPQQKKKSKNLTQTFQNFAKVSNKLR